jgi:GH15 family glucan-1,4-alpha-glucosidase
MSLKLGLIGNCQYNALISPTGNVEWLCWPRFDSSFVFGGLLDRERGGVFSIGTPDGNEGVQQYLPNTNVLATRFSTRDGVFDLIDFAPRFVQFARFYKPKMLIRIVRPVSGNPLIRVRCEPTYDYGMVALSSDIRSNHINYGGAPHRIRLLTNASLTMLEEGLPFVLTKPQYFALTWEFSIDANLRDLCESYLERTVAYWHRWVKHCHLPTQHQRPVIRSALALKLHQFEDTGAIIAATTTSIPEARDTQRNWDYRFCWLRDAYFTLQALNRLGHFEEMEAFVTYLRNIVETGGDRLQPVYGISGKADLKETILTHLSGFRGHGPVRIGNQAYEHLQHDIYGEMIMSISPIFLDARFVMDQTTLPRSVLAKLLRSIELYVESHDAGLWEYRGIAQLHTFSTLMHWAGAVRAAEIARTWCFEDLLPLAERLAAQSQRMLNELAWSDEVGAFTQAAGSKELDSALLLMIPLGFLDRKDPRALSHVNAIRRRLETENNLLRRYVHSDDFGATDNAFTVCSFWLVEALARLGEKAAAEQVFKTLLLCGNHLHLYSEDLEPRTLEQWGNFPQAYSHVGLINSAFALSAP